MQQGYNPVKLTYSDSHYSADHELGNRMESPMMQTHNQIHHTFYTADSFQNSGNEVMTWDDKLQGEKISYGSDNNFSKTQRNFHASLNKDLEVGRSNNSGSDHPQLRSGQNGRASDCSSTADTEPVIPQNILAGIDPRTNVCVKNVPNKYTYEQIKNHFDERHSNRYNDLKVPWDAANNAGKSYLFINFRHPLYVYEFYMDH